MDVMSLTSSPTPATAGVTDQNLAAITGTDFMSILIKQLQYQDPFEPMSNQEMVSQMATIRELETNTRLGMTLEQITDQQRFGSAAALIGKHAQGMVTDSAGTEYPVAGVVMGVEFTSTGEVILELDNGAQLPLSALQRVTEVA